MIKRILQITMLALIGGATGAAYAQDVPISEEYAAGLFVAMLGGAFIYSFGGMFRKVVESLPTLAFGWVEPRRVAGIALLAVVLAIGGAVYVEIYPDGNEEFFIIDSSRALIHAMITAVGVIFIVHRYLLRFTGFQTAGGGNPAGLVIPMEEEGPWGESPPGKGT